MKKNTLTKSNWYKELVDECKGLITEGIFSSRWVLIETYHKVGKLLREEKRMDITDLVNGCAVDMQVSERKLWYAVKFFDQYPDISKLPEGKNISWQKIKTQYLTEGREKQVKYKREKCPNCGFPL